MSGEEPGQDSFGSPESPTFQAIVSKKKPPPPPPKKVISKVSAISPTPNGIASQNARSPQDASMPNSASTAKSPQDPAQEAQSTPPETKFVVGSTMIIKVRDSSTQTDPSTEEEEESSEREDTASTVDKDEASDAKGASELKEETQGDDNVEVVNNTAVGRIYTKNGKRLVVDESKWKPTVTADLSLKFSVMIERDAKSQERIFLSSKYLQKLFGRVCNRKHYPTTSLRPDGLSFSEPYTPLFFHYEEMMAAAEQPEKPEQTEGFDPTQIQKDLRGLKSLYEKLVLPIHEKVRGAIKRDSVGYDDLWAVFKPGDLLYGVDDFSQPRLYIIAATTYRKGVDATFTDDNADGPPIMSIFPMMESMLNTKKRFVVQAWYIDWDSSARHFVRKSAVFPIHGFIGTRRVTDIDIYPVQFYKGGDQNAIDELLSRVEARGQTWKSMISTTSTCMHHDGPATKMNTEKTAVWKQESENNINLNERVIVDNDGWALFGTPTILPPPLIGMMSGFMGGSSRKEAAIVVGGFDETFASYDKHPPSKDFDTLQAQLCPSEVFCCSIRTMTWYRVTISNLRPVGWRREAIDSLVVDGKTKRLLRGLVEEHKKSRTRDQILSDFIPNKGCGLVIVLHGPPGVGKTLTAECISEYTGKPLYPVNIGEMSSDKNIAARLETIFEKASRWDVVLLMDEADVVLEQRSFENMKRNGVVAVFLQMLEYYRGILFLTTNRLGTMDIAFQSRVSLAIKYNSLTPTLRRQIWLNFIARLSDSEKVAKEQLLEHLDDVQEWELNGRQIRNILTMAQSLALAENRMSGTLKLEHIEQVAAETLRFQDYFDEEYRESRSKLSEMKDRGFREKRLTSQSSGGALTHGSRTNRWT